MRMLKKQHGAVRYKEAKASCRCPQQLASCVCVSHLEINSPMLVNSSYVCSPSQPYQDERPWSKFMPLDHPCIPD